MGCLGPDAGQPELRCDGRDHWYGPIGGHGEDAIDADSPSDRDDLGDVHEVDDISYVSDGKSGRVGVPVDGGHAEPARAGLLDRASLMTSGANEENGLHGRRC